VPPASTVVEPPAKASHSTRAMESFRSDIIILISLIYCLSTFTLLEKPGKCFSYLLGM
jgi:hypothetical protein